MIWPWEVRAAARRWRVPYVEAYYRLKVIRLREQRTDRPASSQDVRD